MNIPLHYGNGTVSFELAVEATSCGTLYTRAHDGHPLFMRLSDGWLYNDECSGDPVVWTPAPTNLLRLLKDIPVRIWLK